MPVMPGRRSTEICIAAIAALLLALTAAGCGGGGNGQTSSAPGPDEFGSEASAAETLQVEATLHGFFNARANNEWNHACSYIAKPIRHVIARIAAASKETKGRGCASQIRQETESLSPSQRSDLTKVGVESVRVEDSNGYVIYESSGIGYAMPTMLENDHWKLAATGGTQLR